MPRFSIQVGDDLPVDAENVREGDDENRMLVSVLFNGGNGIWIITTRWAERPISDNPIYQGSAYWPVTGHLEERFQEWQSFKARLDELAVMLDYYLVA